MRSSAPCTSASASWEALGTTVVLRVLDAAALAAARTAVELELGAIDRACSRFRADSELSRLNARAGRVTSASPLLIEALELGLRGAELTDGDVDPTIGRAVELAGYDRDWRLLDGATTALDAESAAQPRSQQAPPPQPRPRITARVRSGWRSISLDRDRLVVHVPAGIVLDLGATAKAWAADRAAVAASAAAGTAALVSVGGDIATAAGAPAGGWQIHVTDDHRSDASAPGQTITIVDGGLATSSTTVRRWTHEGRQMHHIIDPASGEPVGVTWRTVSVAAASCTDANIASTASLVRGERAPQWLERLGLPARLVDLDGRVRTVGGWPARELGAADAVASARHVSADQTQSAAVGERSGA